MTIRSWLRTRTVNVGEIRAISLQPKGMSGGVNQWIPESI
jgi:hypothetical protein